MDTKHYSFVITLAMIAGLVGGSLSSWIFTGTPVLAQKTPKPAKVLTAEEFRLVDKDGKTRARLFIDSSSLLSDLQKLIGRDLPNVETAKLALFAKEGKRRLELDEFSFRIIDEKGKDRIALLNMFGRSELSLLGKAKEVKNDVTFPHRFELVVGKDGNLSMQLFAETTLQKLKARKGTADKKVSTLFSPRAELKLRSNGTPALIFKDKEGNRRSSFGLSDDGGPILGFMGPGAKLQAVLGYTGLETELASLILFDKDENVIWKAP